MFYVIQENVFRERHYDILKRHLIKFELPFVEVRLFPFVDKIVDLRDIPEGSYNVDDLPELELDTNHVFCFGAVKLARIAKTRNWHPGSMLNDNHDFTVYRDHYKDELLNYDSIVQKVSDPIDWSTDLKFIRPTKDSKAFTGAVFNYHEWKDVVENYLHNYRSELFNEDTLIQVSTPKKIYQEIRCWVINGKVVTASNYRIGSQVIYQRVIDDEPIKYAQKMVDLFQLNDAFVIDVCETDSGWKIVECGCINCAGFYDADMYKMLLSIEEHFNKVKI